MQLILQELPDFLLDLYAVCLAANDADQPVIRVTHIVQTAVIRMHRVGGRKMDALLLQGRDFLAELLPGLAVRVCHLFPSLGDLELDGFCGRQRLSAFALAEACRHGHDPFVQFVQIDVRQDRTDDPALCRAAVGGMQLPGFHVSGIQELPDQPQKTIVMDSLFHDAD